MADSKKYNGSTWEHSLRKLSTATDTITTLPIDLYADGNNATVGLKGNTTQSGTPTPDSPIMPQGTGERTENLIFKKIPNANIGSDGKITGYSSGYEFALYVAEVEEGETYTTGVSFAQVYALYENEPIVGSVSYNGARIVIGSGVRNITIPTGNNIKYIVLRWASTVEQTMFNEGSTALPYEPYGYKIPISSANTTTPVYLGEVQTTRKIRKLVLTGEENTWSQHATLTSWFMLNINTLETNTIVSNVEICSHYKPSTGTPASIANGEILVNYQEGNKRIIIKDTSYSLLDNFKSYLQQQYAAGTPVTVWYVLATAVSSVVNEPLMKIGEYADTVSNVSIPVTAGGDTLSVGTTVQPSEVTVNYKGWHPVADVHERDNGAWT